MSSMNIDNILGSYPKQVSSLFREALSIFLKYKNEIDEIIIFGSLVNGDFCYLRDESKEYILSDFDFIVVQNNLLDDEKKEKLFKHILDFNIAHSFNHLGFQLTANSTSDGELIERFYKNPFFGKAVLQNYVIINNTKCIKALDINPSHLMISDFNQLFVANELFQSILISLDKRFTKINFLQNPYLLKYFQKSVLKLTFLFCIKKNYYPSNIDDAIAFINKQNDFLNTDIFFYLRQQLTNPIDIKDWFKDSLINNIHSLFIEIIGFYDIYQSSDLYLELQRSISLIEMILHDFTLGTEISPSVNILRVEKVVDILKQKKNHYNFYKYIYGIQ